MNFQISLSFASLVLSLIKSSDLAAVRQPLTGASAQELHMSVGSSQIWDGHGSVPGLQMPI